MKHQIILKFYYTLWVWKRWKKKGFYFCNFLYWL